MVSERVPMVPFPRADTAVRATEGTSALHRAALGSEAPTALTRACTGRTARGIANRS
jgi:hypothetical protein